MKPKIQKEILEKVEEAAKQYERAELFWNCSNMTEEEIEQRRDRFFIGYQGALKSLTDRLFPKNATDQEKAQSENYLKEKGLTSVVKFYLENERKEKKESLLDPSITDEQRKGLLQFHQWLYRNCDREGMKGLGKTLFGSDGSARNFADKFISQPASVQLKALYLLENNKRKDKDEDGTFSQASQNEYVPNLDCLKDKLTATKWKVWKRTNGSYLYWNKLNESLEAARTDQKILLEFREKANELAKKNPHNYRESTDFKDALKKMDHSEMEAGEKTETIDKIADVTDTLGAVNDDVDMVQMAAINLETGIKQARNKFKALKEEPDGYMNRLVNLAGGEKAVNYYNKISTLGFSTVSAVSGAISIYAGVKELAKNRSVQNMVGQVGEGLDIGVTGSYVTETLSGMTGTIGECFHASKQFADVVGNVGTYAFGCANLLAAAKGIADISSGSKGKSHAERARIIGEELKDQTIQDRAKFAKYLNNKNQNKGIRQLIQGSAGIGHVVMTLVASSVPIAGQAAAVASIGLGFYESYVAQNQVLQEKYRNGIDTELFHGGRDFQALDKAYKEKLKKRMEKLDPNSTIYKKLKSLREDKNKNKRYDIFRKEKAVETNNVFLRDCYENVVLSLGEEVYKNVFYIDPKKAGKFNNLITKENYEKYFKEKEITDQDTDEEKKKKEEHNKQVKTRISYKELMESFGVKAKFDSSEKMKEKLQKKYKDKYNETQMQERMEEKLAKKQGKIANTFTKK